MKKLKNFKDITNFVKKDILDFVNDIQQKGGFGLHLRALTAQMLWFILFYSIAIKISPVKDFYLSNVYVGSFFVFISLLWKNIKNKLPNFVDHLVRGEFFYDLELRFLNLCILCLVMTNLLVIFFPAEIYNKIKSKLIR